MTNVVPKDLAMVVDAEPPWAGATCTVLRAADVIELLPSLRTRGPFWWVEMARPMRCWTPSRGYIMARECVMPDAHLRKLSGPGVITEMIAFNPLAHEQTA